MKRAAQWTDKHDVLHVMMTVFFSCFCLHQKSQLLQKYLEHTVVFNISEQRLETLLL